MRWSWKTLGRLDECLLLAARRMSALTPLWKQSLVMLPVLGGCAVWYCFWLNSLTGSRPSFLLFLAAGRWSVAVLWPWVVFRTPE